ncbi:sensor histidine kinase [Tenacibaculum caenipelagi]|uniref:histidine kinase n=1 Tax=Tenacibaculum caenipelagi TaxID=1325435 RepID=A0A4R6TMB4_9FLAO|nr:HAMP domain-containing sensor histidine kinase [Tenacibaculum caenipelagi]TDQ30200.1 histidine kinase/DNA gyrase B/HSP90-like ATPase [Tenacibaculum caenipelagi]
MTFFTNTYWVKRISISISLLIVSFILWNTYVFFQKFKEEERAKMELFAAAMKEFESNKDLNASFNLEFKVFENIENIPTILVDKDGTIKQFHNLDSIKSKEPKYLQQQLAIMKKQNEPILLEYLNVKEYIYYRNSDILYKLKYYPLALVIILGLFLTIIYMVYKSNKVAEQNKLWTGMAKETAHQIGTPLSSLLGWIAILRTENISGDYVDEIEKDVRRLNTIANRFSKIGSLPELKQHNIVAITKTAFDYLENRSSKQISFNFNTEKEEILSNLNTELYGWVIENLIKNAIDAMQGKGSVTLNLKETSKHVKITVIDTGKGIQKSQFSQIFKPGFTTKKRGWGLGLSLSKRIIEDYHNGKIHVLKSEVGKGTTFEILLNKV